MGKRRLLDWSERDQFNVLIAVREAALRLDGEKPGLREIARLALVTLLKKDFGGKEKLNGDSLQTALVNVSAMILGTNAEPADKQLLQRAVQRFPQCEFLWLVLGRLQGTNDKEAIIAKKIYQDDKIPLRVRVAAAVKLRSAKGSVWKNDL